MPSAVEGDTTATLEVSGCAPPTPSICARVGRPHDPQQQVVALGRVGGQVGGEEVQPLGRPAAHLHGPDPVTDVRSFG